MLAIFDSVFWLDTGTHDAMVKASNFIKTVEDREGKRLSCIEEIAYNYLYEDKDECYFINNKTFFRS